MAGEGDPAPPIDGIDIITGASFNLAEHLGKVILLGFVMHAFPGTENEEAVRRLQNLWDRFIGLGLGGLDPADKILVVAVDTGGDEGDAVAWMGGLGVTFPAIHDPAYAIHTSYYTTLATFPPHFYVIGRDGVICADLSGLGLVSEGELEGHVMDALYARDPVDVEMVMDVSDSMNDPSPSDPGGDSKIDMMKQAVSIVGDFLFDHGQVDDRMGLVWFTDDAHELESFPPVKLFPVQDWWRGLRRVIRDHDTGTCTAMGAGLQKAFNTLEPPSGGDRRHVILCTDGMQNIDPMVTRIREFFGRMHLEIIDSRVSEFGPGRISLCGLVHSSVPPNPGHDIADYGTHVHVIGIGITDEYSLLLEQIASETGGLYRETDDPATDLDLIYLLALCDCMAGASPAVVHHNAGRLSEEECETVECFYLNRSVRKVTVMLSWKKVQSSSLAFWLRTPDGTLLDLHEKMKFFETHCMATFYLPIRQNGEELSHVGQWRMIIRGESDFPCADYHAMVVAEDRETHYHVDFPRKLYEVGDILPVHIQLTELEEPLFQMSDIVMETAQLRVPLAEILAQHKVSSYELQHGQTTGTCSGDADPIGMKLKAITMHPHFKEILKPMRTRLSLQEGNLECKITEKGTLIPVVLTQPGLISLKVTTRCETPQNGPVSRTDLISVHVGPGKADPKQTTSSFIEMKKAKGQLGAMVRVVPKNNRGQMLGPGLSDEFKVLVEKRPFEAKVEDMLDGTYEIEILHLEKVKVKEKYIRVSIKLQGSDLWTGKIERSK
ncbi:VWA domain-containing protein [Chloroflexota bacterium]